MPHWDVGVIFDQTISLKDSNSDDDAQDGECTFLVTSSGTRATNPVSADQYVLGGSAMFKLYVRPTGVSSIRIRRANVYFSEEYMAFLFGVALDGPKTSEWTCTAIQTECPETFALNGFTSIDECVDQMQSLKGIDLNADFSGSSRACKNIHSTFAARNPAGHCGHTSIVPQADSNGVFKCQDPGEYVDPLTLFTEEDIEFFENKAEDLGLGPDGLKTCNCEDTEDYCPYIDGSYWRLCSGWGQANPLPPKWFLGDMPACAACAGIEGPYCNTPNNTQA